MGISEHCVCKKCGAGIRFIDLPEGKRVPVDAPYEMVYAYTYRGAGGGETFYTAGGQKIVGDSTGWPGREKVEAYRPHFGTCARRRERKRTSRSA